MAGIAGGVGRTPPRVPGKTLAAREDGGRKSAHVDFGTARSYDDKRRGDMISRMEAVVVRDNMPRLHARSVSPRESAPAACHWKVSLFRRMNTEVPTCP